MVNTKTFTENNKFLRQPMNIIQSKNHKMGAYEINIISLSRFINKMHILNSAYGGLALVY